MTRRLLPALLLALGSLALGGCGPAAPTDTVESTAGSAVTSSQTLARVRKIVAEHLGCEESKVETDSDLHELGADDIDLVEILEVVEEAFGVEIPDADAERFTTVGDIAEFVEKAKAA